MTETMCLYEGRAAGEVTADHLLDSETEYPFMPCRSKAHLDLAMALNAKGSARVVVEWEGRRVEMTVTGMDSRSITLKRT